MEKIVSPVSRYDLKAELTEDKFIRKTNYGNNEVYIFTHHDSPNLMREVGRLRELSFRTAGGGTGKAIDIDKYDTSDDPYGQLIVWDPVEKEILGGYRFFFCWKFKEGREVVKKLATANLFYFSDKFIDEYFPNLIEFGRSFVQPAYQSSAGSRKGLFVLDNLWDGLGALTVDNPEIKYFFGKITMYPQFNKEAKNLILFFFDKYFKDDENLLTPIEPLKLEFDRKKFNSIFHGKTYLEDYKILSQHVRSTGENIPPLFNTYMNLSPTMKVFGTVINKGFGNVHETGIMITLKDMYTSKLRYFTSYRKDYEFPSQ